MITKFPMQSLLPHVETTKHYTRTLAQGPSLHFVRCRHEDLLARPVDVCQWLADAGLPQKAEFAPLEQHYGGMRAAGRARSRADLLRQDEACRDNYFTEELALMANECANHAALFVKCRYPPPDLRPAADELYRAADAEDDL